MAHADLIAAMLSRTATASLLDNSFLIHSLARAKGAELRQVGPEHPIWLAAARIFPEALDGHRRAELEELGLLPAWAPAG